MKKQYGVAPINQKEYNEAANETGIGGAVARPMVKIDGPNVGIIEGEFELPSAKETKEATAQLALRVLGVMVTKDMLAHTPSNITAEHVGCLLPYVPFSYHRRFGATYTDRVCPASTRTGRCQVCDGRVELFQSDAYEAQRLSKDAIMKSGFGTRQMALVVARVYFNDEDLGIRVFLTPLTNEKAQNAKHDNFFDLVAVLASPKKLMVGETLPADYYSNGDGARWLIAEYVRALYTEDPSKTAGEQKSKRPPVPYWKLSKIEAVKELPGVGKACDIWWPEIPAKEKGKKVDAIEVVDVYALLDHTPAEELEKIAKQAVDHLLHPKQRQGGEKAEQPGEDAGERARPEPPAERPSWAALVAMGAEELVSVGEAFGGDPESLKLVGAANEAVLRRSVAKLCGVTPTAVTHSSHASQQAAPDGETQDDEQLPF